MLLANSVSIRQTFYIMTSWQQPSLKSNVRHIEITRDDERITAARISEQCSTARNSW